MGISFEYSFNLIEAITVSLAWLTIGFIVYRLYKNQLIKPKIWKVFVSFFVGLFSFSLNLPLFETVIKVSILPLGVWILYGILKGKERSWDRYRSFAWFGFFANFIFLAAALIAIPAQQLIYPQNELSTYISNIDHSSIMTIHSSAEERSLDKNRLLKQLPSMRREPNQGVQWYADQDYSGEGPVRNERFPYQLMGAASKWGSGQETVIYIEEDGKGMLITTPKKQLYFRSDESVLKGGE